MGDGQQEATSAKIAEIRARALGLTERRVAFSALETLALVEMARLVSGADLAPSASPLPGVVDGEGA